MPTVVLCAMGVSPVRAGFGSTVQLHRRDRARARRAGDDFTAATADRRLAAFDGAL